MMITRWIAAIGACGAAALVVVASDPGNSDWPMWGGTPDRNMVSTMENPPTLGYPIEEEYPVGGGARLAGATAIPSWRAARSSSAPTTKACAIPNSPATAGS